jgi:hypothetical protein
MATALIGAGIALALLLLLDLRRRLDALPASIYGIAKQERDRDERHAATALTEATAAKVISITAALRVYEEELAATSRLQSADAEKRARMAERRLSDAGTALEAAAMLVRELRAVLDGLRAAPPAVASEPDPDTRATVEMLRPATSVPPPRDGEDDEPEELTTVTTRAPETTPMADRAVGSRARVSPHAPAVAPPGSAEALSPEPAQRAAGLTRPAGSSRPPVALATPSASASAAPRRATLLGIPPPSGVQRSAPTLVSMTAVRAPRGEDGKPGGGR